MIVQQIYNNCKSLSETSSSAAHGDRGATGIPDEWTPATTPPPEFDDWQPEIPSLSQNVKGMYLYILRCSDGTPYVGITEDIKSRFGAHVSGQGALYTRSRRPLKIVFLMWLPERVEAYRLEKVLKLYTRIRKEFLVWDFQRKLRELPEPTIASALAITAQYKAAPGSVPDADKKQIESDLPNELDLAVLLGTNGPVVPSRNLDVKGQFLGGSLPKNCCEAGALDRQPASKLSSAVPPPADGLPSGERLALLQAIAADPSRPTIQPTAANERLSARSVGHRGPANDVIGRGRVSKTSPLITNNATVTPVAVVLPDAGNDPRDALTAVHYLALTVPVGGDGSGPRSMALEFAEYLWPDGMYLEQDYGRLGYTRSIKTVGGGDILYHPGEPGMGVHISLSGKALEAVALTPVEIISTVLALGGSVKRLDVYADSHEVPLSVVREACKTRPGLPKGFCVSKARSCPRHDDLWKPDEGETVYIGSRGAQRFVRFYDKLSEQELTPGVNGNPEIWSRCEVELKREQAQHAALLLVSGQSVRDLVFSCVDFRDRSQDANVSRCDRLPWWEKWSGAFERVSFAVRKVKELVEGVENVVKEAFEKAVGWIVTATTSNLAFIDEVLKVRPSWAKELGSNAAGVKNWAATLIDSNRQRIPADRQLALQALQERDAAEGLQAIEQEALLDDARRQAQQAQEQAKVDKQYSADKLAELRARFGATFRTAGAVAA